MPKSPPPDSVDSPSAAPPAWGVPLYPNRYVWLVFVSAMDVFMTFLILYFGGREVNKVADYILQRFGIGGMAFYKFILITIVILIIEYVGRKKPTTGRRMAEWSIALTCVPVVIAFVMLIANLLGG